MIQRLLIVGICLAFFECHNPEKADNQEAKTSDSDLKEQINVIEFPIGDETILELIEDLNGNNLLLKTKRSNELISVSGCGNSQFIKDTDGTIKIDSLIFGEGRKGFLVSSFVNGSTYGAETHFMIYKKGQWIVSRLPFSRMRIIDINEDGTDELIEYQSQNDSLIYNFQSGVVVPFDLANTTK